MIRSDCLDNDYERDSYGLPALTPLLAGRGTTAGFAKLIERAGAAAGFTFKAHPHATMWGAGAVVAQLRLTVSNANRNAEARTSGAK
jgi:hypothetical protein